MVDVPWGEVDPVVQAPFSIRPQDRIGTAGSCFAQHIARHLQQNGFNYYVSEAAHPLASPEIASRFNYGTFTARYGNIYTARQLLQLVKRAYGEFAPAEDIWSSKKGSFIDPFRPQIQPGGFPTKEEFYNDRAQHFARIRQAIEGLDVFIFTLGLTECWTSAIDGAAYPLCPGVAGGEFNPATHRFLNMTVTEVTDDLTHTIDLIRARNPGARIILTVSPVPLIATAEDRHVLVSTTYSKSALRVAAEQVSRTCKHVAYFPSYEIITGNHVRGRYFAPDLRSVTEEGVAHVMRLFLKHYAGVENAATARAPSAVSDTDQDAHTVDMAKLVEVACEEEALDRPPDRLN
jgi:hypothetical protein